jgi:hypothetical protein
MKLLGLLTLIVGIASAQAQAKSSYTDFRVVEGNCGKVEKVESGSFIISANAMLTESYSHMLIAKNSKNETRYVIFPFAQHTISLEKQLEWAEQGLFDDSLNEGSFDSHGTLLVVEEIKPLSGDTYGQWISKSFLEDLSDQYKVNQETVFKAASVSNSTMSQESNFKQTCSFKNAVL